jgi:hypothetical protein
LQVALRKVLGSHPAARDVYIIIIILRIAEQCMYDN